MLRYLDLANRNCIKLSRLYSTRTNLKFKQQLENKFQIKPHHKRIDNKSQAALKKLIDVLKSRETQLSTQAAQTKIAESNLKSNDLNELVDFNVNQLDKMSEELELEVADNKLSSDNERINEEITKLAHVFQKYSKKRTERNQNTNTNELFMLKRNKQFNKELNAYMDACFSNPNMTGEAIKMVDRLIESISKKKQITFKYISDVEIYNKVFMYYANKADFKNLMNYFRKMRLVSNIVPNIHSFAACLLCIGNDLAMKSSKLYVIRLINDIEKFNYKLDDIVKSELYNKSQLETISKAIGLTKEGFEFATHESSDNKMRNELLAKLKTANQNETSKNKVVSFDYMTHELMMEQYKDQVSMENLKNVEVPSILKREKNENLIKKHNDTLQRIKDSFKAQIAKSLAKKLQMLQFSNKLTEGSSDNRMLLPFMMFLPPGEYVDILMQEINALNQMSLYHSDSYKHICIELGAKCETRHIQHKLNQMGVSEKLKKAYQEYSKFILKNEFNEQNHREKWVELLNKEDIQMSIFETKWPVQIKLLVGKFLMEILIKDVKFDEKLVEKNGRKGADLKMINAFYTIYRSTGVYKKLEVKVHPELAKFYVKHSTSLTFDSNVLPMVVPPTPWCSLNMGGYLLTSSNLLRLDSTADEQLQLIKSGDKSDMNPIYDALNTLGSCPWRVNTKILDLAIKIFNNNGSKELNIAQPETEGPEIPVISKDKDKLSKEEFIVKIRERNGAIKKCAEMYSLWCTELYRLSIANMYRDTVFWFPHSLDFRGRTYAIPPHMNHMGNDISRSLIVFAEGRKLGEKGLDRLKIHTINLTGTMKRSSIDERLKYANEIIDDIVDSGENPLDGRGWWKKSEEPWQTLACCIEIAQAIKHGPGPAEYVSHLPIHQDGSCNGLQHYAALGRDELGANSVNLNVSDRPQDVYSDVCERVESQRKRDAESGEVEIARILENYVKRKTIKQTIMTTVYNVTKYGAREQILRQLEDMEGFPTRYAREGSKYLADQTFNCINEVFSSARSIQEWLSKCAYLIARIRNSTVQWQSPLGLRIVQPYYKKQTQVHSLGNNVMFTSDSLNEPNSNKQKSAFPPNYVHSLDSVHMMLTALYCQSANIRFVSVHDCFWTHAADVDLMNKICREQFIQLHNQPLLEKLSKDFIEKHGFTEAEIERAGNDGLKEAMKKFNEVLSSVPKKGDFKLENVQKSVYFFS